MAAIAIDAVVHVAAHSAMRAICLRLRMAVGALEHRVVARIGVTGGADAVCAAMIHREPGVIEGSIQPSRRGVAGIARGRKPRRNMVRVARLLVHRLVTGIAVGRRIHVVVVDVAVRAGYLDVGSGQRKLRIVVVERCGNPGAGAVAHIALLR